jgi:hypothetical protein
MRGMADYLGEVLPDLLTHLSAAQATAADAVADSAESWSQASGIADDASARSDQALPAAAPEPGGSHLRPVEDVAGSLPLPAAPRLLRPGFAPPEPGPSARAVRDDGAPPPRLLVSGLTVESTSDLAPEIIDLTQNDRTAPRPSSHRSDDSSSR